MKLFKNFIRERQLKKLAKCNEKIDYYSISIKNDEKIIAELQKVIDSNHAISVRASNEFSGGESGIYWLNKYATSYIERINQKQETVALAHSKIEYWKTLKKNILAQSSELHMIVDITENKPFS